MSYILNIETATKNCSVALSKNGQTLFLKEIAEEGYSHAERLHVFIESVLQQAQICPSSLAALAVSQGPGSYTGLRIGVSAAKGLSYALGIPLIATNTLQSLAAQVSVSEGWIVPMLDARRMEVYSAIFSPDLICKRPVEAEIITENSFADYSGKIYFIGDCSAKCKPFLNNENHIFLEEINYPSAKQMSAMSFEKFINNDFVDVAYFEPFYLKDFITSTPKK